MDTDQPDLTPGEMVRSMQLFHVSLKDSTSRRSAAPFVAPPLEPSRDELRRARIEVANAQIELARAKVDRKAVIEDRLRILVGRLDQMQRGVTPARLKPDNLEDPGSGRNFHSSNEPQINLHDLGLGSGPIDPEDLFAAMSKQESQTRQSQENEDCWPKVAIFAHIHTTISRDNTKGDTDRRANLLAQWGDRTRRRGQGPGRERDGRDTSDDDSDPQQYEEVTIRGNRERRTVGDVGRRRVATVLVEPSDSDDDWVDDDDLGPRYEYASSYDTAARWTTDPYPQATPQGPRAERDREDFGDPIIINASPGRTLTDGERVRLREPGSRQYDTKVMRASRPPPRRRHRPISTIDGRVAYLDEGNSSSGSKSDDETSNSDDGGRRSDNDYPKRGKTSIPITLVKMNVLSELGYPFRVEGNRIVIQQALGRELIRQLKITDENATDKTWAPGEQPSTVVPENSTRAGSSVENVDKEIIQRLCRLGFTVAEAKAAYRDSGQQEDVAANLLYDRLSDKSD